MKTIEIVDTPSEEVIMARDPLTSLLIDNMKDTIKQMQHFYEMDSTILPRPKGYKNGEITSVRSTAKIGRNELCACGSGKKYKKCCLLRGTTVS